MNRQWLLAERPRGAVSEECFSYREEPRAVRPDGTSILLRHELFLCAPTIRNWISGNRDSYYPTVEIGAPVLAPAVSRIIESDDPRWPAGSRVFGLGSWQDEQWVEPVGHRLLPGTQSSVDALGLFGINSLTAYCGLTFVGQVKAGEVLLISGAAGSVGTMASQIGRILGCRVIAICGGADKARWLREDCGVSDIIDYKSENIPARLDQLAPDGIDVFFDNVGGPLLRDVVARLRKRGRVILCGQIATYDLAADDATPPLDMMRIIYGHIRLEGFIVSDYADRFADVTAKIAEWKAAGSLSHREDVRDGFIQVPETFAALFRGDNHGTLIARISDEAGNPI